MDINSAFLWAYRTMGKQNDIGLRSHEFALLPATGGADAIDAKLA